MTKPNCDRQLRLTPDELIALFALFGSGSDPEFWPDTISLREDPVFDRSRPDSSRLDIYIPALAVGRGGRPVTHDQAIPLPAVRSAGDGHTVVL